MISVHIGLFIPFCWRQRGRRRKDRCCLKCIIRGPVMRYAALLCVSAHNLTTYGSFIQLQLQKTFLDFGFILCRWVLFPFLLIPCDKKYGTADEMAAQTDVVQFRRSWAYCSVNIVTSAIHVFMFDRGFSACINAADSSEDRWRATRRDL